MTTKQNKRRRFAQKIIKEGRKYLKYYGENSFNMNLTVVVVPYSKKEWKKIHDSWDEILRVALLGGVDVRKDEKMKLLFRKNKNFKE